MDWMHLYICLQTLGAYVHIHLRDQAFDLGQDLSREHPHGALVALGLGYGLLSPPLWKALPLAGF